MPEIKTFEAVEILDSRGQPTVQVEATLTNGVHAVAGIPARGECPAKYNRLLEIEHRSSLTYALRDDDVRH